MPTVYCDDGSIVVVETQHGRVVIVAPLDLAVSPRDARLIAIELQAAAERIDPQPPPRDRGPRPARGRRS